MNPHQIEILSRVTDHQDVIFTSEERVWIFLVMNTLLLAVALIGIIWGVPRLYGYRW